MGTNNHETDVGYKRGSSRFLAALTPKKIILEAIKSRLAGTGITKLVLIFNVKTDKYNVMLSKEDGDSMKLEIEKDDITKIKKLFVNRVYHKFQEKSDKEIKAVIIEINLAVDDIRIFMQDEKDEVELFNYKMM